MLSRNLWMVRVRLSIWLMVGVLAGIMFDPAVAQSGTPDATLPRVQEFDVPRGAGPHDVAPAVDGGVWYTAQLQGALGYLDPRTGQTRHISLGQGSAPHGVIVGPDGAPWVTDSGLNAIVRVDPQTDAVTTYKLDGPYTNLNTAVFDLRGILWFTGQSGYYGYVNPETEEVRVFNAPRGRGPYGITVSPTGVVYYASLAGSHIAAIDVETGEATVLEPPTSGQGARRVWSDSKGRLWISEWNAGQVGMYDPTAETWKEWKLPGQGSRPYAVFVDDEDIVWLSDFSADAIIRFDPTSEQFETIALPSNNALIRQMHGRPGEVWGAESGTDKLVVVRTS